MYNVQNTISTLQIFYADDVDDDDADDDDDDDADDVDQKEEEVELINSPSPGPNEDFGRWNGAVSEDIVSRSEDSRVEERQDVTQRSSLAS